MSCHCFTPLLKAAGNEGGFLAAGEVHPESSGVAGLCFGCPSESCAGVWGSVTAGFGHPSQRGKGCSIPWAGWPCSPPHPKLPLHSPSPQLPAWGFIRHLCLACKTFHSVDKRLATDLGGPHCARPLVMGRENVYLLNSYFCILDTREHFF